MPELVGIGEFGVILTLAGRFVGKFYMIPHIICGGGEITIQYDV